MPFLASLLLFACPPCLSGPLPPAAREPVPAPARQKGSAGERVSLEELLSLYKKRYLLSLNMKNLI